MMHEKELQVNSEGRDLQRADIDRPCGLTTSMSSVPEQLRLTLGWCSLPSLPGRWVTYKSFSRRACWDTAPTSIVNTRGQSEGLCKVCSCLVTPLSPCHSSPSVRWTKLWSSDSTQQSSTTMHNLKGSVWTAAISISPGDGSGGSLDWLSRTCTFFCSGEVLRGQLGLDLRIPPPQPSKRWDYVCTYHTWLCLTF